MIIDIFGKDQAEVLAALYNAAYPHTDLGYLDYTSPTLSVPEARKLLAENVNFDIIHNRHLYLDFSNGNMINTSLYDKFNDRSALQVLTFAGLL